MALGALFEELRFANTGGLWLSGKVRTTWLTACERVCPSLGVSGSISSGVRVATHARIAFAPQGLSELMGNLRDAPGYLSVDLYLFVG